MKKMLLWKKAQNVLIRRIAKKSFIAPKVLFFLAQYKDLNDETVLALVKMPELSQEKRAIANKILSTHQYRYEHSRQTEKNFLKFLGRDFLLAAKVRKAIWTLP